MQFRRSFVLLCVVFVALAAAPARAANVLANPNFDTAVAPWAVSFGGSWDNTKDFGGNTPTNGSLLASQAPGTNATVVTQCISPVTPSTAHSLGAKVFVTTGSTGGWIDVNWFAGPGCGGGYISTTYNQTVSTTGSWLDSLPAGGNPITSPATAASALVEIIMVNSLVGSNGIANFDNTFFGPGTFPVELQRFDAE